MGGATNHMAGSLNYGPFLAAPHIVRHILAQGSRVVAGFGFAQIRIEAMIDLRVSGLRRRIFGVWGCRGWDPAVVIRVLAVPWSST